MRRFLSALLITIAPAFAADYWMYIGTYTNDQSKGIYAWRFNPSNAKLTSVGLVGETASPSFLAVSPNQGFVYAVNEISKYNGESAGSVSGFSIDRATGKLTALNTVSSRGPGPCHLAVDQQGKLLVVANYSGGSVAAYPLSSDGRIGESSSFFQHSGKVALPERQGAPHAHSVVFSPDNRFALVADLGLDQIFAYRVQGATLAPNDPPFAKVAAGAGPRHLAFHPNGRMLYAINEIDSTITQLSYDPATAGMHPLQTISTLPKDFTSQNSTAEIAVHPSGKFLYGSNRGHDSIAVFKIDSSGALSSVQYVSTQGSTPRSFAIDPTGRYLFVANQKTNNIVLFRINPSTGQLSPAGALHDVPTPVCITFVKVK